MALDTAKNREELIEAFQRLSDDDNFCITSRKTPSYNCIAWAMGFDDRWVDYYPDSNTARKKWWPEGVDRDFRPETLVRVFEMMGFVVCDDDMPEDGYPYLKIY